MPGSGYHDVEVRVVHVMGRSLGRDRGVYNDHAS
jgi:hypothetical protein